MVDTQNAFPKLNSEFVDEQRKISIPWYRFLVSLWNRTGGSSGTVSVVLDSISSAPGAILYRGLTEWLGLNPGIAGQALLTEGPSSAPKWADTVSEVDTGTGLVGGPITKTGTISVAPAANQTLMGNVSGGAAVPVALPPTTVKSLLGYLSAGDAAGGSLSGTYPNPSLALAPASTLLGNNTAGAAASVPLTLAQIKALLDYVEVGDFAGGDLSGTYPNPSVAGHAVSNAKLAQMAGLRIKGNASGATADAADLTVAQVLSMLGLATGPGEPNFLAYLSANQAVTSGTTTKVLWDASSFNTGGYFNSGTSLFLPLISGTYAISASLIGYDSAVSEVDIYVYKNGAWYTQTSTKPTGPASASCSVLVQLNGTTDYVEIFGRVISSGGAPVFLGGSAPFSSWFEAHRIGS